GNSGRVSLARRAAKTRRLLKGSSSRPTHFGDPPHRVDWRAETGRPPGPHHGRPQITPARSGTAPGDARRSCFGCGIPLGRDLPDRAGELSVIVLAGKSYPRVYPLDLRPHGYRTVGSAPDVSNQASAAELSPRGCVVPKSVTITCPVGIR